MKRTILIAITLLALLPDVAKGQWTFDIVSVEAYINDHKKQRSLLLARSTLEYSNQLLHEYSREETGKYKEVNIDLDLLVRLILVMDFNAPNQRINDLRRKLSNVRIIPQRFHQQPQIHLRLPCILQLLFAVSYELQQLPLLFFVVGGH